MSGFVALFGNLILYFLIGTELFINMPMNGVYRLPGHFRNKDDIIITGFLLAIVFASLMTLKISMPLPVVITALVLYFIYTKRYYRIG